jgi:hypothetical protein
MLFVVAMAEGFYWDKAGTSSANNEPLTIQDHDVSNYQRQQQQQ